MKVGGESSIMDPIMGMLALIFYVLVFIVACPIGITLILYRLFDSPQVLDAKEAPPRVLQGGDRADTPMTLAPNVPGLQEP
jgi:hypothetical protein